MFVSFFCISVASQLSFSVSLKTQLQPSQLQVCACAELGDASLTLPPNKHVSPTTELIFKTNVLLTWPLIPVRQPCAWVMLWNRHAHICLCHGPQHQVSRVHQEGRRDHRHNGVPRLADKKIPAPVVFHSSDGSCWRWQSLMYVKQTRRNCCGWSQDAEGPAHQTGPPLNVWENACVRSFCNT